MALPLAALALTAAVSAAQGAAGTTTNNAYQKYNRNRLKTIDAALASGQVLTPEEEEAIRQAYLTPAVQEAMTAQRRAEQLQHGALANRGGASGAGVAATQAGAAAQRSEAMINARTQEQAARVQARKNLEQEKDTRVGLKAQMRGEDIASISRAAGQMAEPLGKLAGAPPGEFQAATLFGMPIRKQPVPEVLPGNPEAAKIAATITNSGAPAPAPVSSVPFGVGNVQPTGTQVVAAPPAKLAPAAVGAGAPVMLPSVPELTAQVGPAMTNAFNERLAGEGGQGNPSTAMGIIGAMQRDPRILRSFYESDAWQGRRPRAAAPQPFTPVPDAYWRTPGFNDAVNAWQEDMMNNPELVAAALRWLAENRGTIGTYYADPTAYTSGLTFAPPGGFPPSPNYTYTMQRR